MDNKLTFDSIADTYNAMAKKGNLFSHGLQISPLIYDFIRTHSQVGCQRGTLLDIGCGSGQLCIYFMEKGLKVIGIDPSSKLLDQFKANLCKCTVSPENATLIHASADEFPLQKDIEVVTSTYFVMNYLCSEKAMYECFRRVHLSLKKDGYFIFDLVTQRRIKELLGMRVYTVGETMAFIDTYSDDHINQYVQNFYLYHKCQEATERYKTSLYEFSSIKTPIRIYDFTRIRKTMMKQGWSEVLFMTMKDGTFVATENPDIEDLVIVIAKK